MGAWECFKKGFEQGLQANTGPDGETSGPNSCLECLVCLVVIIIMVLVLGMLGVEPHSGGSGLPWDP